MNSILLIICDKVCIITAINLIFFRILALFIIFFAAFFPLLDLGVKIVIPSSQIVPWHMLILKLLPTVYCKLIVIVKHAVYTISYTIKLEGELCIVIIYTNNNTIQFTIKPGVKNTLSKKMVMQWLHDKWPKQPSFEQW